MTEQKGPKAFKRHIFDDKGKKILIEALEHMKRAVGKLDTVCDEHLVEDWVIVYKEGSKHQEKMSDKHVIKEKELEQMWSFYSWIKENYPEVIKKWLKIATGG